MDSKEYCNTVTLQVESLFELAGVQAERCFNEQAMLSMMQRNDYAKIKRIVLTGCGDSFSASGVTAPVIKKLGGLQFCQSPDPMEFSKFYTKEDLLAGCTGEEVLVVATSASGSAARIVDILETANAMGAKSMLVSNNPASKGAAAAQHLFYLQTPALCNTPGLRSYFASMVAQLALGAFIGVCKGLLTNEEYADIKAGLVEYVMAYQPHIQRIDGEMLALAQQWKSFEKIEVVGDGAGLFSAQFVEEKFIECAGVQTSHTDSEDWCHINFFLRRPENIGTVFQVGGRAPSFDRVQESIRSAAAIGRPVLVVSDAAKEDFDSRVCLCQIPPAPEKYSWLLPVMDFIPGALLAGYCAAAAGKLFFAGRYDFRRQQFLQAPGV